MHMAARALNRARIAFAALLTSAVAYVSCGGSGSGAGVSNPDAAAGSSSTGGAGTGGVGAGGTGGHDGDASPDADADVDAADAGPATGTSCNDPIDVTAQLANGGKYQGQATGTGADALGCGGSAKGPRAYLKVTLDAGAYNVLLSATGQKEPSDAFAVRVDPCDVATELECWDKATFLNPKLNVPKTGTVHILLQGESLAQGFTLGIKKLTSCSGCPSTKVCNAEDACVECASTADCTMGEVCDGDYQYCRACQASSECTAVPSGKACISGKCGCNQKSDCAANEVCGAAGTCVECDSNQDCASNPNGFACELGKCTCTNTGECPAGSSCDFTGCVPIQCPSGYVDCNGYAWDGCEAKLLADPENCGICFKDCGGGACNAGACGPIPETIAGTNNIQEFALDATHLYYSKYVSATSVELRSVSISGGTPVTLATGNNEFASLVVDATHVYYATGTGGGAKTVHSIPKTGGTPQELGTFSAAYADSTKLQLDGSYLYFSSVSNVNSLVTVHRLALPSGAQSDVATNGYFGYHVAGNDLFTLVENNTGPYDLVKLPSSGGASTALGSGLVSCPDYASDSTHLYFVGADARRLSRIPLGGGTVEVLLSETAHDFLGCLTHLRVGPSHVYIGGYDDPFVKSALLKIPKTGGPFTILSHEQTLEDVELSATHVYWSDNGVVKRLPL